MYVTQQLFANASDDKPLCVWARARFYLYLCAFLCFEPGDYCTELLLFTSLVKDISVWLFVDLFYSCSRSHLLLFVCQWRRVRRSTTLLSTSRRFAGWLTSVAPILSTLRSERNVTLTVPASAWGTDGRTICLVHLANLWWCLSPLVHPCSCVFVLIAAAAVAAAVIGTGTSSFYCDRQRYSLRQAIVDRRVPVALVVIELRALRRLSTAERKDRFTEHTTSRSPT